MNGKGLQMTGPALEALASTGLPLKKIAALMGMPHQIFYEKINEDPNLLVHYRRGMAATEHNIAGTVVKTAMDPAHKDWFHAAKFWLQCCAKWKEEAPAPAPQFKDIDSWEQIDLAQKALDEAKDRLIMATANRKALTEGKK